MKSFTVLKLLVPLTGAMLLSACDFGFASKHSSGSPAVAPSSNRIVATPSDPDGVQVAVGSRTTLSVIFTTDDGRPATNLALAGSAALPSGWTGPANFTCAWISTGNGCMLNLDYAPAALEEGNLTLNFAYTNNAGASKTGTFTLAYAGTEHNNVIARANPAQVPAVVGTQRTVSVTFTTDDGRNATMLTVDNSALPTDWSGPAAFSCATVNTGSGCVMNLTYSPTTAVAGAAVVRYTYKDGNGTGKYGTLSIAYGATTHNNVVATQTPAGQIDVTTGSTQTVKIDFTTDDGNPASGLTILTADLSALPTGWTGPGTFSCATVSTGNGCELGLSYHPTQTATGNFVLHFTYLDDSGAPRSDSLNVAFRAGADNTIIATPSPSGTINAVVGSGAQTVTVTFNSSDGNPASNMSVSAGLGTLPAGWTGPATFNCASVNTGNGCQLTLNYAPSMAAAGSLQLQYTYVANSGAAKTGTVTIAYAATTHNNLVVTSSPSGTIGAVVNGGAKPVTLTFTTDDGNPATMIAINSGLAALPAGWTGPATFTCATASTGTGCQLALSYAPTVNGSGTISLGYSYLDDSGTPKTGTFDINYASIPGYLYITDLTANLLRCAISPVDASLSSCSTVASGLSAPIGLVFSGNWAYVAPGTTANDVAVCPVAANGTLGACVSAHTFGSPNALAVSGGRLYVSDANGPGYVHSCDINNADGTLSNCHDNAVGPINTMDGIAVTATKAYIVDINGGNLTTCAVSAVNGTLSGCTQQSLNNTTPLGGNTPVSTPRSANVYGGNLYVGTHASILMFPIAADGSVTVPVLPTTCSLTPGTSCTIDIVAQTPVVSVAFNNGYAYVSGFGSGGGVGVCKIESTGVLDNCTTGTNPSGYFGGLAAH